MTVVAIRVSEDLLSTLDWGELPTQLRMKKALSLGLRTGVVPMEAQPESDVEIEARVALSATEEQRLRALPVDSRVPSSLAEKAAGVIRAYCRVKNTRVAQNSGEQWISRPRVEQPVMCRLMAESQQRNEILFLEASTGVGKGRALVAHAAHIASEGHAKRVLIAAPTISVLGQLYTEYETLNAGAPSAASIIGLKEFVCETSLRTLLEDPDCTDLPDIEAARRWYEEDARKPWGALKKPWLCDSLEEVAPGFPIRLVRLNQYLRAVVSEDEDSGARAHGRCSREATDAAVVFVTHAMLAIDIVQRLSRSRSDGVPIEKQGDYSSHQAWWHADLEARARSKSPGLLPAFDVALIDEAHLLEESFERATSDEISIFSLKLLAEEHGTKALRATVNRVFKRLTDIGRETRTVTVGGGNSVGGDKHSRSATRSLATLVRSIKSAEKSIKSRDARLALQDFRRKFQWVTRGKGGRHRYFSQMVFSPTRRYPLIEQSKHSVNRELSFLWKYVQSAVLTSATLYQESRNGRSITDLRKELRVPAERTGTMTPIQPRWVTSPVTVRLPPARPSEKQHEQLLIPPKHEADEAEWDKYYDRIAAFLEKTLLRRQKGGTLVLMTSYHAAESVASRLSSGRLRRRIIVSERSGSFARTREQYIEATSRGEAPVWLACGRAWTGLNVSTGSKASEDHAIDYLVIPRLPVLMNCSGIRRERVFGNGSGSRFGFREVWQCGRSLRQGIGRLVRRRGVPKKEIFVLDGRLATVGNGFGVLRFIFNQYSDQKKLLIN